MNAGPVEVFGQYLVYEQLGLGGMARVNRAELTGIDGLHRQVALKRMLPHVAANEDMVKAFVREARLASHLRHANVAQTYEFGTVDGAYFIAMELVTGPTLREILKHCAQTAGHMPIAIALNILNQICDALDYAHNLCDATGQPLGIIHRDVSPSNIIIDEAGVVKLIDFGVAKASAAGMQTTSGMIKGKFAYMAPEYLTGDIDARADLFAIGVIAHELLTARPLFAAPDDMETLRRLRTMPLQPPSKKNPEVPPEIDDIVMTALSRDPDHRWQHATALRSAVTTVTRRLGLVCTNQQVVEWVASAFEDTQLHSGGLDAGSAHEADVSTDVSSYPSVQIEGAELPPRPGAAAASQKLTLKGNGNSLPAAPPRLPLGTPSRAITAQPAGPGAAPTRPERKKPRASVPAFGRHEGLLPSPRNSDEIKTTPLRPSAPRLEALAPAAGARDGRRSPSQPPLASARPAPRPAPPAITEAPLDDATELHDTDHDPDHDPDHALGDATEIQADASLALGEGTELSATPPARAPQLALAGPHLVPRARSAGGLPDEPRAPAELPIVTLLDGGAALRSRAAAPQPARPQALAPPAAHAPLQRLPSVPPLAAPQPLPRSQAAAPPPPQTLPYPGPPVRARTGSDAPRAGAPAEPRRSPFAVAALVGLVTGATAVLVYGLLSQLT